MSEEQSNIFKLDGDCWSLILDLTGMSVREILSTERTSKAWRDKVHEYLSHRRIRVIGSDNETEDHHNCLILTDAHYSSFKRWVRKRGHLIRSFEKDCQNTQDVMEILRHNCPNIQVLELKRLKKKLSPVNIVHFPHLRELSFEYCDELTDTCITQLLGENLEKITIKCNKRVTHKPLTQLKLTKLKHLELQHCRALKIPQLISITQLSGITALILTKVNRNRIRITNQVYLILEKMPRLEHLDLSISEYDGYNAERNLEESNIFFKAVCRLKKLRYLVASFEAHDQHLEALAEHCKELEALHVCCRNVTRRGRDALCRQLGDRLTELNLSNCDIADDDAVACIRACPKLTLLDVSDCFRLIFVIELAAAVRREMGVSRPLKLITTYEDFSDEDEENVQDVIDVRYCHEEYPISFEDEEY